jgi:hypothetical protein
VENEPQWRLPGDFETCQHALARVCKDLLMVYYTGPLEIKKMEKSLPILVIKPWSTDCTANYSKHEDPP